MAPKRNVESILAEALERREPAFTHSPDGPYWVKLKLDENWDAYVRLAAQDGHPAIAELRVLPKPKTVAEQRWIEEWFNTPEMLKPVEQRAYGATWHVDEPQEPQPPDGGLTARALRGLQLGRAMELAYDGLRNWLERSEADPELASWHEFTEEAIDAPRHPGRKGRNDRFYAQVAALYVRAVKGGSRRPNVDVAERFTNASADYVRDLLSEARRRELLTRPPKGRAGGELTAKGLAALKENRRESE